MHRLINGALHFHSNEFESHRDLFERLSNTQEPHTLFITCADSRVMPTMITHANPGDLFILRNIGNIVPPANRAGEFAGAAAAIDYAVDVLKVDNIVVCGHSNCGGCSLLADENKLAAAGGPTRLWMDIAKDVRHQVESNPGSDDPAVRQWMIEQANVLQQMKNLLSYQKVKVRFEEGNLTIKGWYYKIHTGEVFQYDEHEERFKLMN